MSKHDKNKIDFIFAQVPLWITYSGLPQKLGMSCWCVYRRLLELRYRFSSKSFFYPLEKLCKTTGAIDKNGMKKILNKLKQEGLIEYFTSQGRGMATRFEIIEPINSPLPEEDVYHLHPRLQSHSYREEKKGVNGILLEEKKGVNGILLEEKKGVNGTPNKKDHEKDLVHEKERLYKKDNNNKKDLSHEKEKYPDSSKIGDKLAVTPIPNTKTGEVVVVIDVNKLKEYGISGDDAEKFLKKYSQAYLEEKIEIIEFKISNGDEIRNIGGMLRKAITEDWQPPPGFTTKTQREEEERRKREAEELALREAREKEERERIERDRAKIAEEWRKGATREELEEVTERARRQILAENPGQNERWLGPLVRIREERIIAEEYATDKNKVRRES